MRWLRHTIPTAGRRLRLTLSAAAERGPRDTLAATARRLGAAVDTDRLRGRAGLAAVLVLLAVIPMALTATRTAGTAPPDLSAALARRTAAVDDPARSASRHGATGALTTSDAADEPLSAPLDELAAPASPSPPADVSAESMAMAVAPTASPEPEPEPAPEPERVAPIGGLNESQMEHAATIIRVGQQMGLPPRAYVVALATALQETYLRNLANPAHPESYRHRNDGSGYDHDSVGLFQQRPSAGWGTVAQCMDPEYAARAFYDQLRRVSGWQDMAVTVAAQTVQVSAFPDHYAKHEPLARQLVDALT